MKTLIPLTLTGEHKRTAKILTHEACRMRYERGLTHACDATHDFPAEPGAFLHLQRCVQSSECDVAAVKTLIAASVCRYDSGSNWCDPWWIWKFKEDAWV